MDTFGLKFSITILKCYEIQILHLSARLAMQFADLTHKENSSSKHNAKTISAILSIVEKLKNSIGNNNSSSYNNPLKILLVNNSSALRLKATSAPFTHILRLNATRLVHQSFLKKISKKENVFTFFFKKLLPLCYFGELRTAFVEVFLLFIIEKLGKFPLSFIKRYIY